MLTENDSRLNVCVLQVEAWDQDCSPQYSQICNYEIVTALCYFWIEIHFNNLVKNALRTL